MTPPDLGRLWETFIRIGPCSHTTFDSGRHIGVLRQQVIPFVTDLRASNIADWFSLMIHDDRTFNIGSPGTGDAVWHLRLSMLPSVTSVDLSAWLPATFEGTRPISYSNYSEIHALDTTLLKSHDILTCWVMLGEQTEWLLRAVNLYREDADLKSVAWDLCEYAHLFANPIFPQFQAPHR